MKKLLIIQRDGAYFLEETFRVLEKFHPSFKEFNLTVLVSPQSLRDLQHGASPLIPGVTTDEDGVLRDRFDLSFNLSLEESSWAFHGKVASARKLGFSKVDGQLLVPDLWSTFLLTVKASAPFLTFHLQDIYRNILGIKKVPLLQGKASSLKEIIIGNFNQDFLSLDERELLVKEIKSLFPNLSVRNVLEVDLISDLSHTLYVGPATLEALRMGEAGATGLYLSSSFQGLNLLPHSGVHFVASSRGHALKASKLLPLVVSMLAHSRPAAASDYSLYQIEHENLFGPYLQSLNQSDDAYPFYQSHVVLWNFLLNLFDVNLDVTECSEQQLARLKENQQVLAKLLRLHDYAMSSIDTVYQEVKAKTSSAEKIEGHLQNLRDIDEVMGKISASHPMLRPFLDFYRIRRGQNGGENLAEQVQHTFLIHSEEHSALSALNELFSVTLRKNEVSI